MSSLLRSRKIPTFTVILITIALTAGCGSSGLTMLNESELTDTNAVFVHAALAEHAENAGTIARGARNLGASLLTEDTNTNAVLSPWALSRVLGQVRLGAQGEGAEAIDRVLGFPEENRDPAFSSMVAELNAHDGPITGYSTDDPPKKAVFHSADGFFMDKTLAIQSQFLTDLRTAFDASVYSVEYPDNAAEVMDAFLDQNTGGLIPKLATPPSEGAEFTILSTNFFAAQWESPFQAEDTKPGAFTRADGSTVDAQLMHSPGKGLKYLRGDGWQAIDLPYTDGFVMRMVLPDKGKSVDAVLTPEALAAISELQSSENAVINLSMPRWDMKYRSDLTNNLKDLGLAPLFNDGVLEGIAADSRLLRIDQETAITVAERGTVAAAVARVDGELGAARPDDPINLDFDHPFIYSIIDINTDTTLFMGRLDDPTATG